MSNANKKRDELLRQIAQVASYGIAVAEHADGKDALQRNTAINVTAHIIAGCLAQWVVEEGVDVGDLMQELHLKNFPAEQGIYLGLLDYISEDFTLRRELRDPERGTAHRPCGSCGAKQTVETYQGGMFQMRCPSCEMQTSKFASKDAAHASWDIICDTLDPNDKTTTFTTKDLASFIDQLEPDTPRDVLVEVQRTDSESLYYQAYGVTFDNDEEDGSIIITSKGPVL